MKICILTWLHNQNFGTLLQAYALQQFLKAEGHDVVDADYLPCVKEKLLNWAINRNSFDLFAGKARELFNRKKEHDDFGSSTADVFNRFLSQNIETTDRIVDTDGLVDLRGKYDAYVCGSDQIWSPYLLNRNFYLSFLSDSDKRIAYAPSFGVTSTTQRKKKIITDLIKTFSSVSVREDAARILSNPSVSSALHRLWTLSCSCRKRTGPRSSTVNVLSPGKSSAISLGIGRFTGKLSIRFQKSSAARS